MARQDKALYNTPCDEISLNRHTVVIFNGFCFCLGDLEISACLTRHLLSFWSTGKFFENLHEGVVTEKAPKLTQLLVEQTTR